MQATIKKRKRVKHTRFPNGFGSICFLSGNRRRPYWAKKSKGKDERGYVVYETKSAQKTDPVPGRKTRSEYLIGRRR